MNKRGDNIMINLLFFLMALAIMVLMVSPIKSFIDIAQGSNFLNCQGFVDADATPTTNYTYNPGLASENISCLAIKLYLPYIFLVFLVGGVAKLLYGKGTDFVSGDQGGVA